MLSSEYDSNNVKFKFQSVNDDAHYNILNGHQRHIAAALLYHWVHQNRSMSMLRYVIVYVRGFCCCCCLFCLLLLFFFCFCFVCVVFFFLGGGLLLLLFLLFFFVVFVFFVCLFDVVVFFFFFFCPLMYQSAELEARGLAKPCYLKK